MMGNLASNHLINKILSRFKGLQSSICTTALIQSVIIVDIFSAESSFDFCSYIQLISDLINIGMKMILQCSILKDAYSCLDNAAQK